MLWRQIHNPLIYVLLGSAALALLMGKPTDAGVVLGVVILNTAIGFIQEYRAGQAIAALADLIPDTASALRDGVRISLPAVQLVQGDIVFLQSGDKVPADLRLLAVKDLQTVEAALTGESLPVEKDSAPVAADAPLGDRRSMAYSSTLVTYGTATGVVVGTGRHTELGRVSDLLQSTTRMETPLTRTLARFGHSLTLVILVVTGLLFAVAFGRGFSLVDATLAAITLAVAAIPEGLPAIISIALAIGVQRMARRRAVIRSLPAVETLGATTVICSDKTGTLTRNEMTVKAIWTGQGEYEVEGQGYEPKGGILRAGHRTTEAEDVVDLLRAGLLCNDAVVAEAQGTWVLHGDPTEGALVTAALKMGHHQEAARRAYPRLDVVPFESEHKFMATLNDWGMERRILLKGAPEVVLQRCSSGPSGEPLDLELLHAEVAGLAGRGMRVLALAEKKTNLEDLTHAEVGENFRLLGLLGMIDPPRPEAIEAIAACQRAGITVKMITGDHPGTAEAIGRDLGLNSPRPAVTGRELDGLDEAEFNKIAIDSHVFARVAPEHKLRLVQALQARGAIVAMTGDGVNDAPALKQADIGVAMGITGTSVSREAAAMVLMDDNFASIRAAVEEGRRVYDNLVKALAFVLPTNLGEALVLLVAVCFFPLVEGRPLLPILPVQILWINLVATVTLALPLAFEAMEPDVMARPPRQPEQPLLDRFLLIRTVLVALLMTFGAVGLFLYEYRTEAAQGVSSELALKEAQTMVVTVLTLMQAFYLLMCRSLKDSALAIGLFSNPTVYAGIGLLVLLQVAFVQVPFFNGIFHSAPLDLPSWLKSIAVSMLVIPVISIEKAIRRRRVRQV